MKLVGVFIQKKSTTQRMKKLALILITVLLASCDRDDDVSPNNGEEIFRLIVDDSYYTGGSGDWLLLHDPTGKLIFSSRFEKGDTLTVKSSDSPGTEKFSVTFFRTVASTVRTFTLQSYTDISPGDQWILSSPTVARAYTQPQGTFTITALDIGIYNSIMESTRFGASALFEDYLPVPYSVKGKFSRYAESPNLVVLRDKNDNLRYKFFEDVSPDQEITVSYDEMKIPEYTLNVDVYGYDRIILGVRGYESKSETLWSGYSAGGGYWDHQRTSVKIGYIDRLKYYNTELSLMRVSMELRYEKTGDPPAAITFPKNVEATFKNYNAVDFSVSLNAGFQRRISQWYYQPQNSSTTVINWDVHSQYSDQKIMQFPREITDLFPTFQPERVVHGNTKFILSGSTYDELIETTFKGKERVTEFEVYSASFW